MKRNAWFFAAAVAASLVADTLQAQPDEDEPAVEEVRDYLARLEKLGFAGSVVISRGGRPILASGYGLADRERALPWGPGTVSTIGSITKQFTGAAILALQESGALSVDDPISKYFRGVPADKKDITLYHLLTHSSGIVDLDGLGDWDPIDREEFIRRAVEQGLQFEPGLAYRYSNAGFSLLGAIIEQLTGTSWEEYVRERLFLPAGMFETGYVLPQWGEGQLAQGYRGGERWGTVLERPLAEDGPYWVLRANGGVHSNAWDMLRWGHALLRGEPLSETSMATYWSPHFDEGGGDSHYGYGWVVLDLAGHRVITHNGGNGILFADMAIVPEGELVMVLQTNVIADFRLAERLLEHIGARLLLGQELPTVPNPAATAASPDLDRLAGVYDLQDGGVLQVAVVGDELAIEAEGREGFAALLSTRPVDPDRARRLTERIDGIVRAYLADDWAPLWEAYRRSMPLERLASSGRSRLSALSESNGSLRGHEVLGTAFRDGRDVTLVRIDFERGQVYRAYVWDPDEEELLGVSVRGLDHLLHVLPEEGGTFASWDSRTGESRPVRFQPDAGGGMRLRIGAVEALRRP